MEQMDPRARGQEIFSDLIQGLLLSLGEGGKLPGSKSGLRLIDRQERYRIPPLTDQISLQQGPQNCRAGNTSKLLAGGTLREASQDFQELPLLLGPIAYLSEGVFQRTLELETGTGTGTVIGGNHGQKGLPRST
jgi:hypothetical protein